jgi:metal-responsive CopG/Arc/MetJ family transcriptional regulator
MKKVLVSLPDGVLEIIESELKGKMGDSLSEIVRSIVMVFLSQNGYMNKKR